MAATPASSPVPPDASSPAGRGGRRLPAAPFEWVSSSPSPAEVAELERLFPEIIQVPAQSLESEAAAWGSSSVIVRSLSRWIPPEAFIREIRRAGVPGEIDAVSLSHKHFLLRFHDPSARERVLHRPWVVNGQSLAVAEWEPEFVPGKDPLLSALLWIRLPLLPMEFWSDESLSSILSAAGEFQFSDDATRLKNRGAYARACVRVDVGSPLRPGARIRGCREPFWQQFSFESVDGICPFCASLHLVDSCGFNQDPAQPLEPPRYGSWMAAVRRRKPIPASVSSPSPSTRGEGLDSSVGKEGWQLPKKWARRVIGARSDGLASPSSPRTTKSPRDDTVPPCRFGVTVPVSEISVAKGVKRAESLLKHPESISNEKVQSMLSPEGLLNVDVQTFTKGTNPFSALHAISEDGPSDCCQDSVPVSSKRGRPIEAKPLSFASKSFKAKGKVPRAGKDNVSGSFSFSASGPSVRGAGTQTRRGAKKLRGLSENNPGSSSEIPVSMQGAVSMGPASSLPPAEAGLDHGSAVALLKNAIQPQASAMAMDLAQDACQKAGGLEGHLTGGSSVTSAAVGRVMNGELTDGPNAQPTE